jgi:hypothetical protein
MPPTRLKDVVNAGMQHAQEENGESEQQETAHLATTFSLPASCE